jgi:hypothetical protein
VSPATLPLLALLVLAGSPEQLELASGERLTGRVTSARDGKLVFTTSAGERLVGAGELARLVRLPSSDCSRRADGIVLVSGDVLEGQALALSKRGLKLDSPRFGVLELSPDRVRALFFAQKLSGASGRARGAGDDGVLMVTGSRTPASLRWLDEERLGLASPLGALDVNKADVAWVLRKAVAAGKPPAGSVRVLLCGGESLTGVPASLAGGKLSLEWEGRKLAVSWDLVRSLESPGAHMRYISDLPPLAGKSSAAVGPPRPPGRDRSAAGGALVVGGRSWPRGVGMRASSRVSYRLDAKWKRFRALAGLDSRAAAASRGALFRVLGDGRELFARKLAPGEKPAEVDVAVAGVRQLSLVLEPGPGLEIGDYGNWVDARLLR